MMPRSPPAFTRATLKNPRPRTLRVKALTVALALIAASLAGCAAPGAGGALTAAQGDQILADLADIKRLLAEQAAHPADGAPARVRLADVAVASFGAAEAPVTLVEFTDYQCPFCKRFHEQTWPELKRVYVDSGKVRLVVRDLPLTFHDEAMPAAVAARCAAEQGRFKPVFNGLLAAPQLTPQAIRAVVSQTGLVQPAFDQCAARPAIRQAIEADSAEASRLGITGTPGFVIAQRRGGQLEGEVLLGAQPTAAFTSRIDALLAAPRAN